MNMSGWCLSDLGGMYGEMGNTKGAVTHYQQALTVVRQLGDKEAEKQLQDAMARFEQTVRQQGLQASSQAMKVCIG